MTDNKMSTQQIGVGYRFALRHDVDRFPDFVAKQGFTGTVTHIESNGMICARIDQPINGADEWGNEIWWHDGASEFGLDTKSNEEASSSESERP